MAGSTKRAEIKEEGAKDAPSPEKSVEEKPLRPAQCRAYMRRALAQEFQGIVEGFIKGAKSGSCPHVKLATELLEPRPRAKRAPSGRRTIERWIDEMERGV